MWQFWIWLRFPCPAECVSASTVPKSVLRQNRPEAGSVVKSKRVVVPARSMLNEDTQRTVHNAKDKFDL